MKTALQELIEWSETPAISETENKSIMTKMKELLEKEKQIIINAHKQGYIYGIRDEYYVEQYSKDYYDQLILNQTGDSCTGSTGNTGSDGKSGFDYKKPFGKGWMNKKR